MEDLVKVFSSPAVVYFILGFPAFAAVVLFFTIGKKLDKLSHSQNRFSKIILLLVLKQDGQSKHVNRIAKKMLRQNDGDIDDQLHNEIDEL